MARRKESSSVSALKHTCAAQATQQRSQNSNFNGYKYRIYYEDTDAGGVVYYANYLKFFERARTDFLRELGISQSELLAKENLAFVVRKCTVEYLTPARLDDVLEISVEVKNISAAAILLHQVTRKSDTICSRLEVEIVCVDATNFKPKRIPQKITNSLSLTAYH
ncbi:MAG: tol-pal system-associated acyl-CoA thioesterase [Alphaproteobacteria bacterium]|nr:tol-pal system-associated acyl-CoA thioesterase [Alphaproteobacteria bacterium]